MSSPPPLPPKLPNPPPELPPSPLHYAMPGSRPRRPITSWRLTIQLGVLTALVYFVFLLVVPRMEVVFKDFRVELPALTKLFLWLSRQFRMGSLPYALWTVPVVVPIVVTQLTWSPDRPKPVIGVRVLVWLLVFGVYAGFIVAAILALFLPMISLMETISGGRK